MTPRLPATALRARLASAVVLAACAVVALVALAAAARSGELVSDAWSSFPGDLGWRGLLLAVGLVAGAAALLGVVARLPASRLDRWMPLGGLALLALLRLVAIAAVPTPIPADDDPRYLHELAVGVLDGGHPLVAHRPMGFSAMLAGLYAVFGVNPLLAELLNLGFALLAGWALHRLVAGAWGPRVAAVALVAYAIVPSQVLMVTTIYTETAYAALLLAAMALAAAALRGGRLAIALSAGAVLALSQYVRPLSQAFLAAFLAAPLLSALRPSRALAVAGALALAFALVLAPILVRNATSYGALSLSTSSYAGWSLFVGANQEHDGRLNDDDRAVLAAMDGSVWERSELLGRQGIERITGDPRGFADLVVRKFRVMWADDAFPVTGALPGSPSFVRAALVLASQLAYAAAAVGAVLGLWLLRRRPSAEAVLLAGTIVIVAAVHSLLEVQPRYHAYVVPLLCALAATAAVRLWPDVERATLNSR